MNRIATCLLLVSLAGTFLASLTGAQEKTADPLSGKEQSAAGPEKSPQENADKTADARPLRIVFLAGRPSHGYGAHEHFAGCRLLATRLQEGMPGIETEVLKYEWPDETAFENCDAIVMYCDGGAGHPANGHLDLIDRLSARGVGIVCLHYGVEVPAGKSGEKFLDWIGGYFEADWSVNPHWTARFETLPEHPITRGVRPFAIQDEWYFHMRFREGMAGVTPILSAIAPEETMSRGDGPHSGNPYVRKEVAEGIPQITAWASERPDGGRGFGFTGGHDHWNWGDENFRKVVLNAIVWTAGGEVPADGVPSLMAASLDELKENQDEDAPEKYDWDTAKSRMSPAGKEPKQ